MTANPLHLVGESGPGGQLGPRKVTTPSGAARWACRACAASHATRGQAQLCCLDRDPIQTKGGELLPKGHRPHEVVLEQLEARMQELEQQAKEREAIPPCLYPCAQCKWADRDSWCNNPLIVGFDQKTPPNVDWQLARGYFPAPRNWPTTALCGREKALWEPNTPPPVELTRWQHLIKAVLG